MVSIEEMRRMLEGLLDELPEPLFEGLNGGVSLLEEEQRDPELPQVFILGEYVQDLLGNSIVLYYGSFVQLFGGCSRVEVKKELRKTLRHEFRHHIEVMAGEDALDWEDARQMQEYRREEEARQDPQRAAQEAQEQGRRDGRRLLRPKKWRGF